MNETANQVLVKIHDFGLWAKDNIEVCVVVFLGVLVASVLIPKLIKTFKH